MTRQWTLMHKGILLAAAIALVTMPPSFGEADEVTWVTDSDGSWHDAVNWTSNPYLPDEHDDVTIDRGDANPLITATGHVSARSFTITEQLTITEGSLTVFSGDSVISGPLAFVLPPKYPVHPPSYINAQGSAATLTITGPLSIDGVDLIARYGAMLSLPSLTTYNNVGESARIYSDDTDSLLDLSGVTEVMTEGANSEGSKIDLRAFNGGTIDLAAMTTMTGNIEALSEDAGSLLDLSGLTAATGVEFKVQNGGTIQMPTMAEIHGCELIVLGPNSTLDQNLTSLDGATAQAYNGATLAFPLVTSYHNMQTEVDLEAIGDGAVLDLSSVTSMTAEGPRIYVSARSGGTTNLSAATTMTGNIDVVLTGADSTVDASSLVSATGVEFSAGGENSVIDVSSLASAIDVEFFAFGGGTIDMQGLASVSGGELSLSGPDAALIQSLTSINGAILRANSGATFGLPLVTEYHNTGEDGSFYSFGTGTVLDLSSFTSLTTEGSRIRVHSGSGGTIDLTGVAALPANTYVTADGDDGTAGSMVDVSNVTSADGVYFGVADGGIIHMQNVASLSGGSLSVAGATSTLDHNLTSVDSSYMTVRDGGILALPQVTSYHNALVDNVLLADGQGSTLDLSSLTTMTAEAQAYVSALEGGTIDLTEVITIDGPFTVRAYGDLFFGEGDGLIDLSNLTSASGVVLSAVAGGTLRLSSDTTTIADGILTHRSTGTIEIGTLKLSDGATLDGDGTFATNVINTAGTVIPGQSELGIDGDYTQGEYGHLEINLSALATGGQQDNLDVSGEADLDGYLDLTLDGFVPMLGETIVVFSAASVSGTFTGVSGSNGGNGVSLTPEVVDDELVLRGVFTTDANDDGHVNGLDYLAWAANYPSSRGNHGTGDFTGDGIVDGLDYLAWAAKFHQGPLDATAVPEPVSMAMFVIGAIALLSQQRRKLSR